MSTSTNIVDLQRDDHARLDELMKRYEAGGPDRHESFRELVTLTTSHAFAEETVLFPLARRFLDSGDPLTGDIESKHQTINELLSDIDGAHPDDPGFEAKARTAFSLIRADARQEEDVLLARMQSSLDESELSRIGFAWLAAKKAAPVRPHPRVSRRPPGNILAGVPLTIYDHARDVIAKVRHSRHR